MTWIPEIDTWIAVTGALCALSCALLGCFLVLRRMSMMGDAISHAVLPGLAIAFMLTGERSSVAMFAGAAAIGVLTAVFTQWVHSFGKVDRGAAMGVVFTTLFAIGLILIEQVAQRVDLDPGCVLYGAIETAPLDLVMVGPVEIPRPALVLGCVLVVNLAVVVLLFKELKISAFDPALATTLGINARAMHYLLMTLVAVTTVASFEAVGSILVIAMLIVPAAAAHLLTDRLAPMILVAMAFGVVTAFAGHAGALVVPGWFGAPGSTNTAGMMAAVAGGLFAAVAVLAPRHGAMARVLHRALLGMRIVREDVLGLLYRLEENAVHEPGSRFVARLREALHLGPIAPRLALATLRRSRLVTRRDGVWVLTDRGRRHARDLVRRHRLWERYLVTQLGLRPDHVHGTAMRLEHVTDEAMQARLAEGVTADARDPHGREIPGRE